MERSASNDNEYPRIAENTSELEGSWVNRQGYKVINNLNRVVSRGTILTTLLFTTHEPPANVPDYGTRPYPSIGSPYAV